MPLFYLPHIILPDGDNHRAERKDFYERQRKQQQRFHGKCRAIDDGSESFTIGPVDNKDGDDTPAKKEIKEEVKEEIKEESTEEVEEPGDGKPEEVKQPVDEDDESKLPKGVIKRLNKMRREKGDSEREVERLREEIESLKKAQQNQKAIGDKPDPTNFDTEAEYLDALTDWKVTKH